MKQKPTISLIVLNYNGLQHLKEYFESVFEQSLQPDEVIMMDNASTDGSVQFVQKYFPQVKIIKNPSNDGTALGSNIAFEHTSGDLVVFQSNDLKLDERCVEYLVKTIQSDPQIGIVTSVLLKHLMVNNKKQLVIDNAGGVCDVYGFGMQKYPEAKHQNIPEIEEVFFSYGGSFIIRRKIFGQVGGYDKRYFTLNDDIDLSWRVRLLGYKIVYQKKSFVLHKVSATLGTLFNRSIKRYWSERNAMRTLLKNHTFISLIRFLPIYFLLQMGEMGFFLYRARFDLFWSDIKAVLWNLWYLSETIKMRRYIQRHKNRSDLHTMQAKRSYKLMLFSSLKNSI
ncbi:MAG: glycosyltransferase family 2 protein [Patescibacteria group bacterium]